MLAVFTFIKSLKSFILRFIYLFVRKKKSCATSRAISASLRNLEEFNWFWPQGGSIGQLTAFGATLCIKTPSVPVSGLVCLWFWCLYRRRLPLPPDSEPVHASGGPELREAEDGVRAVGAAHEEVCELAAVADAHPSLLHLYQHDPLHQNLPQTQMMTVIILWTLSPDTLPCLQEQSLHRPP